MMINDFLPALDLSRAELRRKALSVRFLLTLLDL